MFHVGEPLFHDREHLEVGCADLARESLATRVILRAVAFALDVQRLLLVEPADDFLQTGLHVAGDVAGLFQVLDDRRREQAYRRGIGVSALRGDQHEAGAQDGKSDGVQRAPGRARAGDRLRALGGVSHDAFLTVGVETTLTPRQ